MKKLAFILSILALSYACSTTPPKGHGFKHANMANYGEYAAGIASLKD